LGRQQAPAIATVDSYLGPAAAARERVQRTCLPPPPRPNNPPLRAMLLAPYRLRGVVGACLLVSLLRAPAAHAQLTLPSGVGDSCHLGQLDARVRQLNKVCCLRGSPCYKAGAGVGALGKGANKCTVDCAAVLLPLMKDCLPMLDALYDHLDKKRDGKAMAFIEAYKSCIDIPPTVVVEELTQLHKKSPQVCTDAVLNNVAKTTIARECKDQNPKCKAGLAGGFYTCPAGGMCDKSCQLCGGGAAVHHDCPKPPCHRRTQGHDQESRRRTQLAASCDWKTFDADMKRLDTKCCDDGGKCSTGIPKACDAKCAVAFVGFFDRCDKTMALRFNSKQMKGFRDLHTTCSKKLPTEKLLEAVAKCRGADTWSHQSSGALVGPRPCPAPSPRLAGDKSLPHLCASL
jgi:hypothetical protein